MDKSIGSNIKTMRKQKGFTQEELASQLGVTSQAVSRWEAGNGMPDVSMIVPLAQILEVTTDAIFGLDKMEYDESILENIKVRLKQIHKGERKSQNALEACEYVLKESNKNPVNYELMQIYADETANLSRYVDFTGFLEDEPDRWNLIRESAIKKGVLVIRYSANVALIEKVHYAMAWIYIHEKDYNKAREHIQALPSVATNRMQESILAQLALFESGFEEHKKVVCNNLRSFSGAIGKEFMYAMEDYRVNAPCDEAVAFGKWGIKVLDTLAENKELEEYTNTFRRRLYIYITEAYLRAKRKDEAKKELEEMLDKHIASSTDEDVIRLQKKIKE